MTKTSRNEPCHCGSGFKYKRCCLRKVTDNKMIQTKKEEITSSRIMRKIRKKLDKQVVIQAPDNPSIKMSEIIKSFAENILSRAKTDKDRHTAAGIACLAWNLALLDEDERMEELEKLSDDMSKGDVQGKKDMYEVLYSLIQHKLAYYTHINQFIVEYQLTGTGQNLRFEIASVVP